MTKRGFALPLLLLPSLLLADDMNYTIKGKSLNRAPLEDYSASPDIPPPESLLFSLDGGKSARESEVIPLTVPEAAKMADLSNTPLPTPPLIPSPPFIVHALPFGDRFDLKRNQIFDPNSEESKTVTNWEFKVFDDNNTLVHAQKGAGIPREPLTWDGFDGNQFLLDPNRVYNSFLILKTSNSVVGTWPGEGVRLFSLAHQKDVDLIIMFGDRVYNKDQGSFSDISRIFFGDLSRRLYLHHQNGRPWQITLFEPRGSKLVDWKKSSWHAYLQEVIKEPFPLEKIQVQTVEGEDSRTQLILQEAPPKQNLAMRGRPRPPRLRHKDISDWIQFKETKKGLFIGLRHDQLFMPGSAYLRDESLPLLTNALARVQVEKKSERPIFLRSYLEKVHDRRKEEKEVDPKLAALRSKVLFHLFSGQ